MPQELSKHLKICTQTATGQGGFDPVGAPHPCEEESFAYRAKLNAQSQLQIVIHFCSSKGNSGS